MAGNPVIPSEATLRQTKDQQMIIGRLREFGMPDKEIALLANIQPATVLGWRIGKSIATSAALERMKLAADVALATATSLGSDYKLGHILLLFATVQPVLKNVTPASYIAEHGENGRQQLMKVPRLFADALEQGCLRLSGHLCGRAARVAGSGSRAFQIEQAGNHVDRLTRLGLSFRDINAFLPNFSGGLFDLAGSLHLRTLTSVSPFAFFRLEQAVKAADMLTRTYRHDDIGSMLLSRTPANGLGGISILEVIASGTDTELSRRQIARRVMNAATQLASRRIRA